METSIKKPVKSLLTLVFYEFSVNNLIGRLKFLLSAGITFLVHLSKNTLKN